MSNGKSPWGNNGGSNGGNNGGGNKGGRGNNPWGGGKEPRRPSRQPTQADLDNVIRDFKSKFGGRGGRGSGGAGGSGSGRSFLPAAIVIGLGVLLLSTSVFTVQPEEEAVILRFGDYRRTVGSGLNFKLPNPVETKKVVAVTSQRETKIGFSDRVRDVKSESLMLTGDENIVDIDFTVLWVIDNLENYLFKVDEPEQMVKAVSESVMREVVGKNALDVIITTEREKLRGQVQEQVQKILDEYQSGIKINDVQFQKTDPPEGDVMQAFLAVKDAEQKAQSLVNEALGHRNKVVQEAQGNAAKMIQEAEAYRDKIMAEANGEAERFRLVYQQYKKAPRVIRQRMYMDVMKVVYGEGEKIMLDGKAGQGVVPYLPLNELGKKGGK